MVKWETQAGLPTQGLVYMQMLEKLRELQELAAMMAHLIGEDTSREHPLVLGWLTISENMKMMERFITNMAQKKLN